MIIGNILLIIGAIQFLSLILQNSDALGTAFEHGTDIITVLLWALGYILIVIGLVFGIMRAKKGNKYTVVDKILLVIFFIPPLLIVVSLFL